MVFVFSSILDRFLCSQACITTSDLNTENSTQIAFNCLAVLLFDESNEKKKCRKLQFLLHKN